VSALTGLLTLIFDLLTLKLVRESHLRWGNLPSKFGHAGPLVLELFAMYATDGQTDGLTDKRNAYFPLPYRRGHNSRCAANVDPLMLSTALADTVSLMP